MVTVPERLQDAISEFVETVLRVRDKKLEEDFVQDALDKLISITFEEVNRLATGEQYEEVAKIHLLVSQTIRDVAGLVEDQQTRTQLESYAFSLSSSTDSLLRSAVGHLEVRAVDAENKEDYTRSAKYKSMAKGLEYAIETGIIGKKLDLEISDFLPRPLLNMRDSVIATRGVDATRHWWKQHIVNDSVVDPETIKVQTKAAMKEKTGWYDWSINLAAEKTILEKIKKVKYTLHPTFPKPEIEVADSSHNGFKLDGTAWGEFEIKVDVYFNNKDILTKYKWLELGINTVK